MAATVEQCAVLLAKVLSPDGHFNFLHLWPGQIPPPRSDRCG
jgi:hypothetical protein